MDNKSYDDAEPADMTSGSTESDTKTDPEGGYVDPYDAVYSSSNGKGASSGVVCGARATEAYAGMGKEDLLRFSNSPFWRRLRLACLVVFWLGWIGLLAAVISLTILLPRCATKPDQDWWQKETMYQVHTRSFQDSDGDGVGDLKGISSRLDYLQSVSVKVLLLSSFYQGQQGERDYGNEVTDYKAINQDYGTMEDFDNLLAQAHQQEMKVVIDFVPNQTGKNHTWFKESSTTANVTNPYWNYYVWAACTNTSLPNNWLNVYSGGPAWTYDETRQECYLHQYTPQQPDLNLRSNAVIEELESVLRFWLDKGVDGFRVISPELLFEDADLVNEEKLEDCTNINAYKCQDHTQTRNLPGVYSMIHRWRDIIDQYSDRVLIVESNESMNITSQYYGLYGAEGAQLTISPQLEGVGADCGGTCVNKLIQDTFNALPEGQTASWATISETNGRSDINVIPSMVLSMTLPGPPVIFYGQEIAMTNSNMTGRTSIDPAGGLDSSLSRDRLRSPMQWVNESFGGFMNLTAWEEAGEVSQPWLPVNLDYQHVNVEMQLNQTDSMLRHVFTTLAQMRSTQEAIQFGEFSTAVINDNIFSYVRSFDGVDRFLIALNFGKSDSTDDYTATNTDIPKSAVVYASYTDWTSYTVGEAADLTQVSIKPAQALIFTWQYER